MVPRVLRVSGAACPSNELSPSGIALSDHVNWLSLSAVSGVLGEIVRVFTDSRWRIVELAAEGDTVSLRLRLIGPTDRLPTAVLAREGDYWSLHWNGAVHRLRHTRGMGYLHVLLSRPGTEVHALQLAAPGAGPGAAGDAGPLLDDTARDAYRGRLAELCEEETDAEHCNDHERASRARREIDALTQQLAQAFGLGGRARVAGSITERARINVTRALRTVIARVAEAYPDLGHHLSTTVHTGTFSAYQPGPHPPLRWRLNIVPPD